MALPQQLRFYGRLSCFLSVACGYASTLFAAIPLLCVPIRNPATASPTWSSKMDAKAALHLEESVHSLQRTRGTTRSLCSATGIHGSIVYSGPDLRPQGHRMCFSVRRALPATAMQRQCIAVNVGV
eukprot:scaffold285439_cov36-Tisochrysis_lutea.AAC.2